MAQRLRCVALDILRHGAAARGNTGTTHSKVPTISGLRTSQGVLRSWSGRLLLVLCLATLLAGCGFHLRGGAAYALPFKSAYVQGGNNDNLLVTRLQDALIRAGVTLEKIPEPAQVVIELGNVRNESHVLTVGSSGDIEEYELYFGVDLAFRRGSGELLQPESSVEFTTDYTYDTTSVLAKEEERETLIGDMRLAAVREILRRAGRLPALELE